jgi:hypothetical protein
LGSFRQADLRIGMYLEHSGRSLATISTLP